MDPEKTSESDSMFEDSDRVDLTCHAAIFSIVENQLSLLLTERNEQTRVVSFDEQRKYLAVASPNVKDVAALILETGMRPEEVYKIRAENVELVQGYVFVPFGKTRAARRRIPLTATALAVLKRRMEPQKGGLPVSAPE